MEEVTL